MKKVLSILLSFVMVMTAVMAIPFDALAKASTGDVFYGLTIYIDGNLEAGKRPSIMGTGDEFSRMSVRYSGGKVMGLSVSCKDNYGNFTSNALGGTTPFYELTYTMNVFDSDDVFRSFDIKYLNIFVNGVKILTNTGNVSTYESGGQAQGGLKVVVKYYNVYQVVEGESKSIGYYSPSQDINLTAPSVEGKHFTYWTGENGNHQSPIFGDANSAVTTMRVQPAVNMATPNYEAHSFDAGVETTAPTTAQAGVKTYTCTVCGETKTEEIPKLPQSGWVSEGGKWYYYQNGAAVKGWKKISKKWYYFNKNGVMLTGWQKISKKWYYFNSSGQMLTGWQKISKKWYYFNSSGEMLTGWQKLSGKWYYFNSSGVMQTGWQKISKKWYYFNSDGSMVANTSKKIGKKTYRFDKNGVCQNP